MMVRYILLYVEFLINLIKYRKAICFRDFCVIHAFENSKIIFVKNPHNKIRMFSSPLSNMLGLPQRCMLVARYGGIITIEEGVGLSGCVINSISEIYIGKNSKIGAGCKIIDNDSHPLSYSVRDLPAPQCVGKSKVFIGEGCFLGMNSIILKGTVLGKNVVVGAGSVVHGIFPDNCVIAGNPAKVIKYIEE